MKRNGVIQEMIKNLPAKPGVYLIVHEPTSRHYVGFSKNVDEGVRHRVAQHFDDLVRGRNGCVLLQDVWNYDPVIEHWTVEFLEETTDPTRERAWMNAFGIPNEHDFNKARCLK